MGNVGFGELVIIFLVTLLIFGAKRVPEIARGLGEGIREFRKATHEVKRELTQADQSPTPRPSMASVAREPAPAATSADAAPAN